MTNISLIDSKTAAAILGVSRSTLQRLVKRGALKPAGQVGAADGRGAMMFTPEEVNNYRERTYSTRRDGSTGVGPAV